MFWGSDLSVTAALIPDDAFSSLCPKAHDIKEQRGFPPLRLLKLGQRGSSASLKQAESLSSSGLYLFALDYRSNK